MRREREREREERKKKEKEKDDGGLNLTLLQVSVSRPLLSSPFSSPVLLPGYKRAGEKAVALLDSLVCATVANLRDADEVARYLRPVVASKQVSFFLALFWFCFCFADCCCLRFSVRLRDVSIRSCRQGAHVPKWSDLCRLNLSNQACVGVLSADQTFNADNVRSVKILGGGVTDSSLIRCAKSDVFFRSFLILARGFVTARGAEGDVRVVKDAKVAVFAAGIDAAKTETKGVVSPQFQNRFVISFSSHALLRCA